MHCELQYGTSDEHCLRCIIAAFINDQLVTVMAVPLACHSAACEKAKPSQQPHLECHLVALPLAGTPSPSSCSASTPWGLSRAFLPSPRSELPPRPEDHPRRRNMLVRRLPPLTWCLARSCTDMDMGKDNMGTGSQRQVQASRWSVSQASVTDTARWGNTSPLGSRRAHSPRGFQAQCLLPVRVSQGRLCWKRRSLPYQPP